MDISYTETTSTVTFNIRTHGLEDEDGKSILAGLMEDLTLYLTDDSTSAQVSYKISNVNPDTPPPSTVKLSLDHNEDEETLIRKLYAWSSLREMILLQVINHTNWTNANVSTGSLLLKWAKDHIDGLSPIMPTIKHIHEVITQGKNEGASGMIAPGSPDHSSHKFAASCPDVINCGYDFIQRLITQCGKAVFRNDLNVFFGAVQVYDKSDTISMVANEVQSILIRAYLTIYSLVHDNLNQTDEPVEPRWDLAIREVADSLATPIEDILTDIEATLDPLNKRVGKTRFQATVTLPPDIPQDIRDRIVWESTRGGVYLSPSGNVIRIIINEYYDAETGPLVTITPI